MSEQPSLASAFTAPLAALGDTVLGALQKRFEVLSADLQAEKARALRLLVWASVAVFGGVMTLTLATVTVVYLFWDTARLPVLAGSTLVYGAALAWAVVRVRAVLTRVKPFDATVGVLREDRAALSKFSLSTP